MTDLPEEVKEFETTELEPDTQEGFDLEKINREVLSLHLDDVKWRLSSRKWFGWIFLILLLLQNIAVFMLVYFAYFSNRLESLGIILSVLVSATLVETVFTVRIIVKWLFRDINYAKINNSNNGK